MNAIKKFLELQPFIFHRNERLDTQTLLQSFEKWRRTFDKENRKFLIFFLLLLLLIDLIMNDADIFWNNKNKLPTLLIMFSFSISRQPRNISQPESQMKAFSFLYFSFLFFNYCLLLFLYHFSSATFFWGAEGKRGEEKLFTAQYKV